MQIQDINLLYDYNYWANKQIIAASEKVSQEQLANSTTHSYGSLRGTLVHLLDAEHSWRILLQQNTFAPELVEADFPTLDLIVQRWSEEEKAMRDYLASLTDDDMKNIVRYKVDTGETRERVLWHCLWHVVNHGTQHRSEAAAMLTEYGQSPGDLDFTFFLNERRKGQIGDTNPA